MLVPHFSFPIYFFVSPYLRLSLFFPYFFSGVFESYFFLSLPFSLVPPYSTFCRVCSQQAQQGAVVRSSSRYFNQFANHVAYYSRFVMNFTLAKRKPDYFNSSCMLFFPDNGQGGEEGSEGVPYKG